MTPTSRRGATGDWKFAMACWLLEIDRNRCQVSPPFSMQELTIYIDGQFYPEAEAKVSVFDHGLLYGDGIFEGIRFYNGRVFKLREHLERLWDSARAIMLTIPMTMDEM